MGRFRDRLSTASGATAAGSAGSSFPGESRHPQRTCREVHSAVSRVDALRIVLLAPPVQGRELWRMTSARMTFWCVPRWRSASSTSDLSRLNVRPRPPEPSPRSARATRSPDSRHRRIRTARKPRTDPAPTGSRRPPASKCRPSWSESRQLPKTGSPQSFTRQRTAPSMRNGVGR